jgi:hypothetical protein
MLPPHEFQRFMTRRHFFRRTTLGLGTAALASLLNERVVASTPASSSSAPTAGLLPGLHFAPRAKRVIFLFMSGGPSHIDLYDYKPALRRHHGEELPGSVRMGQRITGMTSGQKSFPCVAPMFEFKPQGQAGIWMSELIPHIGGIADDLCLIR